MKPQKNYQFKTFTMVKKTAIKRIKIKSNRIKLKKDEIIEKI